MLIQFPSRPPTTRMIDMYKYRWLVVLISSGNSRWHKLVSFFTELFIVAVMNQLMSSVYRWSTPSLSFPDHKPESLTTRLIFDCLYFVCKCKILLSNYQIDFGLILNMNVFKPLDSYILSTNFPLFSANRSCYFLLMETDDWVDRNKQLCSSDP